MRIAFLSPWRVDDPAGWSGVVRPMYESLAAVTDVVPVVVPEGRHHLVDRAAARAFGSLGRSYLPGHAIATSRKRSRAVSRSLRSLEADAVLSVAASTEHAYSHLAVPVVEVGDTTFGLVTNYYPLFSGLPAVARWQGELLARRTARRASGFVVSSRWAATSLCEDYGVARDHVRLAPFGPAVVAGHPPAGPEARRRLRLLFVGSDWVRKGGDAALGVLAELHARGVDVELTVVGPERHLPAGVRSLGRVPRERMGEVYATHDVLLETATANAGGVTLTDATASGLPVVATRTGGVPDIVDDGVTGILVPPEALVPASADAVQRLSDPATCSGSPWRPPAGGGISCPGSGGPPSPWTPAGRQSSPNPAARYGPAPRGAAGAPAPGAGATRRARPPRPATRVRGRNRAGAPSGWPPSAA